MEEPPGLLFPSFLPDAILTEYGLLSQNLAFRKFKNYGQLLCTMTNLSLW